ncbi:hypothetical protein FIA58_018770 [Flavobacterium jejuense]|uniref:Uncharacterized protein n=1 Tax=Flavobacterium jejuense TaxID=1544455 RepID=A0ABX0IWY3_9FLAO|nr:hypothetical protein [Flavobacterium jejuense]NHN27730.1 hypothetical protein [Flavobacterium jejuense]
MDFYLLYHGWWELENIGANYYYEGANLNNIESVLKLEAKIWIDKYIYGKVNLELQEKLKRKKHKILPTTFSQRLISDYPFKIVNQLKVVVFRPQS